MELANCISVHFKRININAAAAKEKKKNLLKMTTRLGGSGGGCSCSWEGSSRTIII